VWSAAELARLPFGIPNCQTKKRYILEKQVQLG
jgi:hypothetical protein